MKFTTGFVYKEHITINKKMCASKEYLNICLTHYSSQ